MVKKHRNLIMPKGIYKNPEERIRKILKTKEERGLLKCSENTKRKIAEKLKGNSNARGSEHPKLTLYNKTHIRRGKDNPNYGNHKLAGIPKSIKHRNKMSETRIKNGLSKGNKNPMSKEINIRKWLKSCGIKPNKVELKLNDILQNLFPNKYKLNVRGEIMILGGKIPDFVNKNDRKIVELYGDYFHSKKVTGIESDQHEKERINYFKRFGFDTLIIWERELKNLKKVENQIIQFNNI